jgi:hypothetical protein
MRAGQLAGVEAARGWRRRTTVGLSLSLTPVFISS